jgi:hypothetical protein
MKQQRILKKLAVAIVCGLLGGWSDGAQAADRIWVPARINGKDARLMFDTGAGVKLALSTDGAKRLGVAYTNAPRNLSLAPGEMAFGLTEECTLHLGAREKRVAFSVYDLPKALQSQEDGVIGWPALRDNVLKIDGKNGTLSFVTESEMDLEGWTMAKLQASRDILALEMGRTGASAKNVLIDSGSYQGLKLAPQEWNGWRRAHSSQPMTMDASFNPVEGIVVAEQAWANVFVLGTLPITEVPVSPASQLDLTIGGEGYFATLGVAALRRLELVLDGRQGMAFLRPRDDQAGPYMHNHLGAVFVPPDPRGGKLTARVAKGSPAHEAGIQDGDVLLAVDGLDVTNWQANPNNKVSDYWKRPAGTKLKLKVARAGREFEVIVTLRHILGPGAAE